MKKIKFILSIAALMANFYLADAQKIAYVNTELVLSEMSDYVTAQNELNTLSDKYKAAIESEISKIEVLYNSYQAKKSVMSSAQRSEAEEEIISKEKVVKEKQKIYFGEDGIMTKKSEELLLPIQSKVNDVIEAIANAGGYDLIIDLAVTQGVVYYNKANDITQLVISACK